MDVALLVPLFAPFHYSSGDDVNWRMIALSLYGRAFLWSISPIRFAWLWLINYISCTWVLAEWYLIDDGFWSRGEYSRREVVEMARIATRSRVRTRWASASSPPFVIGNKYRRNYHSMVNWICTSSHNVARFSAILRNPIKGQSRHGANITIHHHQSIDPISFNAQSEKYIFPWADCRVALPPPTQHSTKNADNLSFKLHRARFDACSSLRVLKILESD